MDKNINGSFKPRKIYFSQVSNHALRDNKLSLKAKGLYALIQSYITIDNFILYKTTLKKVCLEGNTSFESGWKELKDSGYLLQERHQNSDGTFYYLYELLDIPIHTPETEGTVNLPSGNGGSYSKTDPNNTDLNNTERTSLYNSTNCRISLNSLTGTDNYFIQSYLFIMDRYGYKHKRINDKNLKFVLDSVEHLESEDVDISLWESEIEEYFQNLPKGNDGDIVPFLYGSIKRFGINLRYEIGG